MPRFATHAHHLDLTAKAVGNARIALLPGDPARVSAIAKHLQRAKHLSTKREFTTYRGHLGKTPVLVTSTGCGAPSTSVCVEELAQLGVTTFIRVGSTGSIQSHAKVGHIAIANAAVRLEGASASFAPLAYPSVADRAVTNALVTAAIELDVPHHVGITASTDTFYQGQERYDTFTGFVPGHLRGLLAELRAMRVLNFEMEASLLFVMASTMGLQAGSVCGIVANRTRSERIASETEFRLAEQRAIRVAIGAARSVTRLS
jgi:uridine phosphorylase